MRDELQAQVDALEAGHTFPSRRALFRALAGSEWGRLRGLRAEALKMRAKRLGVVVRTGKGALCRAARPGTDLEHAANSGEAAGDTPGAARPCSGPCSGSSGPARGRVELPLLRQTTPARYGDLVGRVERGSLKAAVKLKCLDCSNWQPQEVRLCTMTDCPLHGVRPYQP